MTTKANDNTLKILFRLVPVLGVLCLLGGFGRAIYEALLDKVAMSLIGIGVLMYLTLFVKAEAANLKYYVHVFIYSVMVLGICIVVYLFSRQYTEKVDLTSQKLYSLAPASVKMLKGLKKDVKITIFDVDSSNYDGVTTSYKGQSDKLSFQVINARKNPDEARKIDSSARNGDVFVVCGDHTKKLSASEIVGKDYENTLSNAILEVSRDTKPKIYFLAGHGEVAYDRPAMNPQQPQQEPPPSLQAFRDFITKRGMDTEELRIAEKGFVPKDANLLVIAGPRQDLLAPEVKAIQDYLKHDGKLMVLVDVPTEQLGSKMENLTGLLKNWSVELPDRVIIDAAAVPYTGRADTPVVYTYDPKHPITKDLAARPANFFLNLTRPIETGAATEGLQTSVLISSSPKSWAQDMADVLAGHQISQPPQSQMKSQPMGVAVSKSAPPQMPGMPNPPEEAKDGVRIVVFGTSELIQDTFLMTQQAGVQLMLNTLNWLTQQEDMIAAPPKQIDGTPIVLTDAQQRLIFFMAVMALPSILFFGGVSYAIHRRKK